MYEPPLHRQDQLDAQHALIRAHPLGLLISHGPQGLEANSIPFLIDPAASRLGTLQAHMARANGQWRILAEAAEALVVFQGPTITSRPSWYATKRETGKVVPTWNYVMVQARGRRARDRGRGLAARADRSLDRQAREAASGALGGRRRAGAFRRIAIRAIVGVEIEIAAITGKWKASQNRPAADRAGVIAGLAELGDEESRAMAAIVREAAPEA